MENFSGNKNLKKLESEIQNKVSFAKEHALSEKEYENIKKEEYQLQLIQNKRELTDEEVEHFFLFVKQ